MNFNDPENVPPVWQVGDVILDRYEVKQVFTGGGMGLVYRVHHRAWAMDLAVKSPRPEFFQTQQHIENFEREAETWVNLGLHPHTVSCYYVRRLGGIPRIFTEFVDGGSLADWIRSRRLYEGGPDRAMERILDIAIQFAWGLHYAHEQGLIHQDVKPGNVLVNTDGTVKVTDFGLAKARALAGETPMSSAGQSILVTSGGMTPAYCSPEQANGKPLSRKTDIWSWAISVFEMFAGEPPCRYGGQLAAEVFESYLETGVEGDGLPLMPKPLAHLLKDCFQRDPKERTQDLYALTKRLKTIFQDVVGNEYPRAEPMPANILADGFNNRAVSLLDLGNHTEAKKALQEALQIHPGHPEATYNLGLSQWRSAEISDRNALDRLDQVHQARPGDWIVPYAQGLLHLERLDPESAIDALNHAAQLRGDSTILSALEYGRSLLPRSVRCEQSFNRIERVIHVFMTTQGSWAISNGSGEDRLMRLWDAGTGRCAQTFQGSYGVVTAISLSRNHRRALSGGADMSLRLWQMESGCCVRAFYGHTGPISSVSLSEDACWGLSGSLDNTVRFWDMESGECIHRLLGHGHHVSAVCLSSNRHWALSGSSDKTVRLWNLANGECDRTFEDTHEISAVAFTKDDAWILSANCGNSLRLWDVRTGRCVQTLYGHTGSIQAISVTHDGHRAVSISQDGTLRLWDLNTGRCLRTFESDGATRLWMSADASSALSASHWSPVRLWNLRSLSKHGPEFHAPQFICKVTSAQEAIGVQKRYSEFVHASTIALSTGHYAEALNAARAARALPGYARGKEVLDLWHLAGMHSVRSTLKGAWSVRTFGDHKESVIAVALSADGRLAASRSNEYVGALQIWDVGTGNCIRTFPGQAYCDGFTVGRDFRVVLRGGGNTPLGLWEVASGTCIRSFEDDTDTLGGYCRLMCISRGAELAFSDSLNAIKVWDVRTGRPVRTYDGHSDPVTCVALSVDERWLISGSCDNTVRLWDTATGQCLRCFEGHSYTVTHACLSGDNKWILSGSQDGTMRLWETATGKCIRVLEGHSEGSAVALTGDNLWALSARGVWELASGRRVWSFEGFTTVSLSVDSRWAIFGAGDGTLQLWELDWDYEFPA